MDVKAYEERLSRADADLLNRVRKALPILSDLSRSDLLLYFPAGEHKAAILDQARPHSIFPVYPEERIGQRVDAHDAPWVFRALSSTALRRGVQSGTVRDAPIVREVLPVLGNQGRTIAALCIDTNLLAYERHRRRSAAFRKALEQLQEMALRGELANTQPLSPFGEHDGIVVVDARRTIQYLSGIATNLYRVIGYLGNLVQRSVYDLETADAELVDEALKHGSCLEREKEEHGRVWIRKAIPLYVRKSWWRLAQRTPELPAPPGAVPVGVMLTVHDATEARNREQELKAKMAMILEVHHRVKNNLQAIASLLRLQARRAESPQVSLALTETVNRILSVAVVHEFLSYDTGSVINLLEVTQRITGQMSQSVVDPSKSIQFQVTGPAIYLSSQQATACALVVNELLQNALEHGFERRSRGTVHVRLADNGESVGIEVADEDASLPGQFDLAEDSGLGLRIVRTLVENDLKGKFELHGDKGVRAVVTFPKTSLGGAKS